jgi:cell wall-associated NlpC family hydrolase
MSVTRAFRRAIFSFAFVTGALVMGAAPAVASSPLASRAVLSHMGHAYLNGTGYWVVDRGGGVASGGGAPELGGLRSSAHLSGPIVAMAATPDGGGYWLASSTGGVYSLGDARFYGAAGAGRAARVSGQIVGMAGTSDGRGYWLASSTGGVYSFGDAKFYGAPRSVALAPVVAIAATPGGGGYWLVSSAGDIFCFGDASYHGSASGRGDEIVGFSPTSDGRGYWMATDKGDVISFGDARPVGSAVHAKSPAPFIGMAAEHDGEGYWFANSLGTTYGYGRAKGSGAADLARHAVAIVADPAIVVPGRPVAATAGAPLKGRGAYAEVNDPAGEMAVDFALSQVGKPYIWGATGPYGYDCSGLALAAWRAAGVYLPRTAAAQYYAGVHIPLSEVEPGDLIFWASDPYDPATIYHVAISLGGDRTVQATQTGQNVQVIDLWGQDLVPVATRP